MTSTIRLCLCLHNHQPVGNFDHVFEQAYQDSYLPFLELFEQFQLPIALHTSGPLFQWLDAHHPDYVDRVAALVDQGRIEIIGGAFYEPILTMIPSRDRIGQIASYTDWLQQRLGGKVQGMWMPERVWEQSLASDIARAGIRYTLLDDYHFKSAGLTQEEFTGYFTTEDDGQVVSIFPGSERLRYTIPFADPQETINHLGHLAQRGGSPLVVFGDDGEKFGSWPDTKAHVYDNHWLRNFFNALEANSDWIQTCTLAEAHESVAPEGKVYLSDGSYREMTEWVFPADLQVDYEDITHELEHDPRWPRIRRFVRGGFWRNFKTKYPESNEMYARMMAVSERLETARTTGTSPEVLTAAQQELYQGQCNCSYWHGAFGGIYLPHLRNAVFEHLIAADNILSAAESDEAPSVQATAKDYTFDAQQEVRLENEHLTAWIAPAVGGHLYELDVHSICHNLLATLTRRPEAYHRKVLSGPSDGGGDVASIHDRVVFKQEGLDQRLQYDRYRRKSLVDHFLDDDVSAAAAACGEVEERGDFVTGYYDAKLRRNPDRIQVQMVRDGSAMGHNVRITKGVTLESASHQLEIAYLLEGLPSDRALHFGVELNFAGLPAGADDRYFCDAQGARLGQLGTILDREESASLALVDEWLGINTKLEVDRPTHWWAYPIETVSQSEGGFELVHQSVAVQPHWYVQGDSQGRWSVTMRLDLDTSLARERASHHNCSAAISGPCS